jgi:hypothetical protein
MATVEILRIAPRPNLRLRAGDPPTTAVAPGVILAPPTRAPNPSGVAHKIRVGAVVIEQLESGDLVISKVQTPELVVVNTRGGTIGRTTDEQREDAALKAAPVNRVTIGSEDVQDLMVALDGVLGNCPSKLTKR